ncbi:YlaH-like family protein [Paenibacillus sp. N1-5-1-14]|uniref:YlaH-like family protein n=1 Tax=Paenibacillus radicibacter TaxID=2972488 RepID=UPI002158AB22|nr:YlaH-like family protein [Paenibacillus radicibacter]MCR8641949.1 YlaH-like family protein [Paenibacillus radicibacter]
MDTLNEWFTDHLYITFIIIYLFMTYVYNKVFRVKKLPLLKALIVYVLMGVGAFMLLIFQVDAKLPIVLCLSVAIFLMLLVRIRYFVEGRQKKQASKTQNHS